MRGSSCPLEGGEGRALRGRGGAVRTVPGWDRGAGCGEGGRGALPPALRKLLGQLCPGQASEALNTHKPHVRAQNMFGFQLFFTV